VTTPAQTPAPAPAPRARPARRTVLIVDDNTAFRSSAARILAAEGFDVVGEAVDGTGALAAVADLRPAVVLLDVLLPDIDGFTVCARLADSDRPPAVVLTSSRDVSSYRRRLAESTALGFIPKSGLSGAALIALVG
jgi:DNA-binding NarL/FixJ family response regulator